MLMRQCLEIFELLDRPDASGAAVCRLFHSRGAAAESRTVTATDGGKTDFVRISLPGKAGEGAKTINITGRLGGWAPARSCGDSYRTVTAHCAPSQQR